MRTAEAAGQPERVLIANTIIGPSFTRVPPPRRTPWVWNGPTSEQD